MPDKVKPESKKFSLKPIETQLLLAKQQTYQTDLSNLLSYIAIERLGFAITANTRFSFNEDMTEITITEEEPEQPSEENGVIETPAEKK